MLACGRPSASSTGPLITVARRSSCSDARFSQIVSTAKRSFRSVRRIEEHDVGLRAPERQQYGTLDHRRATFELQRRQILANRVYGEAIFLQENSVTGAAAEGFNPHRPGACVPIQENRAFDASGQDIEERFAQTIGRGPGGVAGNALQAARTKFSGDHAHPTVTSP